MKFSGYVGYDTRNNLEHFGDDRFNPLDTGFLFFYFLGPCLLATSRNTGWMDIHEIFRIWTQEAIGYTVSRVSRLLHALQTRRGEVCDLRVLLVVYIIIFVSYAETACIPKPNLHTINTCYATSDRLSRQPNGHAPEPIGKYYPINVV